MTDFEDRISRLPDEILVTILSFFNIVEASRTCVLSKRWQYLWTRVKVVQFYFPKMLRAIDKVSKLGYHGRMLTDKYVHWVNQVIQLHQGPHITDFKVVFFLTGKDCDIDEWFIFAIRKSVQRLELNLCGYIRPGEERGLSGGESYTPTDKVYSLIKSPYGLSCLKSLTQLSLTCVNVTGELIEHFLSNCPLLVGLCVSFSQRLVNLKVSGASLCLKFLEISNCYRLETIDIYAPNLASLIILGFGETTPLLVWHAPSLVDLTVARPKWFLDALPASYFSHLESLTLSFSLFWDVFPPSSIPEFTNLKNLTFGGFAKEEDSFIAWTSVIERAPLLRTFTLQLMSPMRIRKEIQIETTERRLHRCLEVVKFVGNIDIELLAYFFQRAVALKTIIVDCRHPRLQSWQEFENNWRSEVLRNHALNLKSQVPPKIEVVICP